jgi:hypothetical protein
MERIEQIEQIPTRMLLKMDETMFAVLMYALEQGAITCAIDASHRLILEGSIVFSLWDKYRKKGRQKRYAVPLKGFESIALFRVMTNIEVPVEGAWAYNDLLATIGKHLRPSVYKQEAILPMHQASFKHHF